MDGCVLVLLHDPQTVSFVPAVGEHVEADLPSFGRTQTRRGGRTEPGGEGGGRLGSGTDDGSWVMSEGC